MRKKKFIISSVIFVSSLLFGIMVLAATYGSSNSGVRNTEHIQLYYHGEAWTRIRGNSAWIKYYRNGAFLGGPYVYKDNWRTDSQKLYDSYTVWDSLNPWAPKTTFTYSY